MRSTRGAFFALAVLGGYFIWRNRSAIQRQLESLGVSTPLLKSVERDTAMAKQEMSKASNY